MSASLLGTFCCRSLTAEASASLSSELRALRSGLLSTGAEPEALATIPTFLPRLLGLCSNGLCRCARPCASTTDWDLQESSTEPWLACGWWPHGTLSTNREPTACCPEEVAAGHVLGQEPGAQIPLPPLCGGVQGITNERRPEMGPLSPAAKSSLLHLHADLCALVGAFALSPTPGLLSQILHACPHLLRALFAPLLCRSAPADSQETVLRCIADLCASPEGCRALLDPRTGAPAALLVTLAVGGTNLCPAAAPGTPADEESRQEACGAAGTARHSCRGGASVQALDPVLLAAASCLTTLLATPLSLLPASAPLLVPDPGAITPGVLFRAAARLRCAIRALASDAQDRPQMEAGREGRAGQEGGMNDQGVATGVVMQEHGGGREAWERGHHDRDTDGEGEEEEGEGEEEEEEEEEEEDDDEEEDEDEGEGSEGVLSADDKNKLLNELSCTLAWVAMLSSAKEEARKSGVHASAEHTAEWLEACPCEAQAQEPGGREGPLGSSSGDLGAPPADPALGVLMRLLGVREAGARQFLEASWEREVLVCRREVPSSSDSRDTFPNTGLNCEDCSAGPARGLGPGPREVRQEASPGELCSVGALLGSVPGLRSPEDVLSRLVPACVGCPVGPALEVHPLVALQAVAFQLGELPREGRDLSLVRSGRGAGKRKRKRDPVSGSPRPGATPDDTETGGAWGAGAEGPEEEEHFWEEHLCDGSATQQLRPFFSSCSSPLTPLPSSQSSPKDAVPSLEPRGVVTPAACEFALRCGYSLAIRGLARRLRPVGQVCRALARLFGQASVGANLYLTPAGGSQGLAKHTDDHCVFVCQLAGRKMWRVYRPAPGRQHRLPRLYSVGEGAGTGTPEAPSVDGLGAKGLVQTPSPAAEEASSVCLGPGDVLYIPRGCAHHAATGPAPEAPEPAAPLARLLSSDGDGACVGRDQHGAQQPPELQGASLHVTFGVEVEAPCDWEGLVHIALRLWALEVGESLLQEARPGHRWGQWEAMEADARSLWGPMVRDTDQGPGTRGTGPAPETQTGSPGGGSERPPATPSGPEATAVEPRAATGLLLLRACEGLLHLLLRALADGARPDLRKARLSLAMPNPAAPAAGAAEGDACARRPSPPELSGSTGERPLVGVIPPGVEGGASAEGARGAYAAPQPSAGVGPRGKVRPAGCSEEEEATERGLPAGGSTSPSGDESTFLSFVSSLGSVPAVLLEGCVEQALGEPSCERREGGGGHFAADFAWGDWLALVGSGGAGRSPGWLSGTVSAPVSEPECARVPGPGLGSTSPVAVGGVPASLEDLLSPLLQLPTPGAHGAYPGKRVPCGECRGDGGDAASAPLPKLCGHAVATRNWRHWQRQVLVEWCRRLKGAFVDSVYSNLSGHFAGVVQEQQRLLVEIRRCREVVESGIQALHRQEVGPVSLCGLRVKCS